MSDITDERANYGAGPARRRSGTRSGTRSAAAKSPTVATPAGATGPPNHTAPRLGQHFARLLSARLLDVHGTLHSQAAHRAQPGSLAPRRQLPLRQLARPADQEVCGAGGGRARRRAGPEQGGRGAERVAPRLLCDVLERPCRHTVTLVMLCRMLCARSGCTPYPHAGVIAPCFAQCLRPGSAAILTQGAGADERAACARAGPEAAHLRHYQRAGGHRPDREEVEEPCAVAAGRGRGRRGGRRRARASGGGGVADAGRRRPQACLARKTDACEARVPSPVCCNAGMRSNQASAYK
jgi:hypothetical protein